MISRKVDGADEQPATTVGRRASAQMKISSDACRLPSVGHANSQVAPVWRPFDAHDAALREAIPSAGREKTRASDDPAE